MTAASQPAHLPPASKDALRVQLMRFLDEEPEDDDNLMDYGLNSITAMQLVTEWKAAAIDVSFVEFARCLTLGTLWALLESKGAGRS
ncbi:hypothetical protein KHC28_01785 [Ancylobacter sonchi]|uniref:phosphopantetheine-binding protein n=1 Tax=Ancylobacter TaxID=99 RepID=UPI001BD42C05|nr:MULTISPECIES: phosphopantetheine-binding protein [Ancylobacter]MBS7532383.1 hypothetical protein [Ancylobacter sonchi]